MQNKLCVIAHSGGLDSSTLMARALDEGYTVLPINYNYGQKNIIEMTAQSNVVEQYKFKYPDQVMDTIVIDFTQIIGDAIGTFQKNRDNGKASETTEMEYYMPSRNLLFMTVSAVIGEVLANDQDIKEIALGLGIHQHSDIYAKDYWDISPKFAHKLQELLSLNDNVTMTIYAPYSAGFKSEIVRDAVRLNVPYELTWTCYNPQKAYDEPEETYVSCGVCEACLERESQARAVSDELGDSINMYAVSIPKDTNGNPNS